MAGDWIKMRVDLPDDPSVISLCDLLEMDEFEVIGRLHKLWSWADKHTVNGVTNGVTARWIDRYVNKQGFADSMISVGWLHIEDAVLSFPGFDIHNGKSAKSRCDSALRTRMSRERHAGVTNNGDARVTVPRPFVRAVFTRDCYTCVYCGKKSDAKTEEGKKKVLSVDHILPHSRSDGRQAVEDLATCCKVCNNEKNDRTPEEWGVLPRFLQDGVEYRDGMLVTKTCYTDVTNVLPEKRREEKSITLSPPQDSPRIPVELKEHWEKWTLYILQSQGVTIGSIEAEQTLKSLLDRGVEKAIRDIEFSIRKRCKTIRDSDNDYDQRSGKGRSAIKEVAF